MKTLLLKNINSKITIQIVLILGSSLVLIILFVQSFLPSRQKQAFFETAGNYVSTLTHGLAFSIGDYLYNSNSSSVREIQKWFKNDANVLFLRVSDKSEELLIEYNPYNLKNSFADIKSNEKKIIGNNIFINVPIKINGENIGDVFVIYSLDEIFLKIQNDSRVIFIVSFIILFAATFFVVRLIKNNNIRLELARTKESDRLKSEFLSQISHEIRTPLNSLNGISSLLEMEIEYNDNIDSDLKDSVDIIKVSSKRIIRTIDLLVDYSIVNSNNYEINIQKLNLSDFIQIAIVKHIEEAEKKNLKILYTGLENDYLIDADSYSLTQILDNLLENAVKYTEIGTITISVFGNPNNEIILHIRDTGVGISREFLSEIYIPFSQEQSGYCRGYDGNGLGLALTKKYCEINNINIDISSIKNIGTEIILTFLKKGKK